jgi:6-phosphogluconolactonase/glucosamine-6-phosphate isomerase/deaminase
MRAGRKCVLGLATGSTPTEVYRELVRMHQQGGLSFANVVSFNLDEYTGLQAGDLQSYHKFMAVHLFDHLSDMDPANIHIPDGALPAADLARWEEEDLQHPCCAETWLCESCLRRRTCRTHAVLRHGFVRAA